MEFFNSAVDTLQTIVIGLGGALCVWGGVNLLEGYGQDNPASKMLMYGKEASNRKQEIDRQHHTIPNKRTKDKHYGNVHNRLWNHG